MVPKPVTVEMSSVAVIPPPPPPVFVIVTSPIPPFVIWIPVPAIICVTATLLNPKTVETKLVWR